MIECLGDADRAQARSRCGRQTPISALEYATLDELPDRLARVTDDAACELAAGHRGSHVSFVVAAQQGDHWWWLRWNLKHRELVRLDPCTHTARDEGAEDDCLLPSDHPGLHSFEL
jgi:hypothetical protein